MKVAVVVLVLALVGAGCYGLTFVNWSTAFSCPKGQHIYVETYVPIMVGKVVVITPIYGCETG